MATAEVQRRLLRTGQGVLGPAEGLSALRWVLRADGRGVGPQVSPNRCSTLSLIDCVVVLGSNLCLIPTLISSVTWTGMRAAIQLQIGLRVQF
jgi:hypothetical protein